MDIEEAFTIMLSKRKNSLPPNTRRVWKYRFEKSQLSREKMTDILRGQNYRIVFPEQWQAPIKS